MNLLNTFPLFHNLRISANNLLPWIATIVAVTRVSFWGGNMPIIVYYGIFTCIAMILLCHCKSFSAPVFLLIIGCILSILGNDIPAFFSPWSRLASFSIMLIAVGPFCKGEYVSQFRKRFHGLLTIVLLLMILISFGGYYLRIPNFLARANLLNGAFNHSMTLGPLSGLIMIVIIAALRQANHRIHKFFWLFCLIISCLTCLLTASRIGVASSLAGVLFYLIIIYRQKLTNFFIVSIIVLCAIGLSKPVWWEYTNRLWEKQQSNQLVGGTFTSRYNMWHDRLQEFYDSPIIGCGFSSVNEDSLAIFTGVVEPGCSWLFLLSSIGLCSTIVFLWIYFKPFFFIRYYSDIENTEILILLSMIVSFGINFIAEGYLLSSGSFLFLYFWLTLARSYDCCSELQIAEKNCTVSDWEIDAKQELTHTPFS